MRDLAIEVLGLIGSVLVIAGNGLAWIGERWRDGAREYREVHDRRRQSR